MKVLLLENIHPVAVDILKSEGLTVQTENRSFEEDQLIPLLKGVDILGIRSKTQITTKVLNNTDGLKAIGAFCIGTDQVNLSTSKDHGVPVFNAPYSNTRSVAELVIGELIALSRQMGDRNTKAHQGVWEKSAKGAKEVRGKILGIVGYGHIGSQLSILAEALGMRVVYYDIIKKLPLGNSKSVSRLSDLLEQSDFVSLHVPETSLTRNMIAKMELQQMRKGALLVNASRGSVVNIRDLAEALKSEHIGGAAVDVFPVEPVKNDDVFKSELQGLPNVILTPHIGGSTEEAQENIGREVADSILRFLKTGSSLGAVNMPHVELGFQEGTHRVLNIHRNVPGVLRDINKIVSDLGGNIKAQSLSTDSSVGYLIMDLENIDGKDAATRIKTLSMSIKTRLLY